MIGGLLAWWAVGTLIGLAALPLVWRLFPRLPDRGYGFSRILGLLVTGYLLWLGGSLGWIRNGAAGALLSLGIVAFTGWRVLGEQGRDLGRWLRINFRTVLTAEVLFLVAFVGWGVVRAYNPEIVATEKPMELAFLNAILRSPSFPPHDPWLSGSAISYYYLGYVLLSVPTRLSGVSAGEAFNLGSAMWFALVVVGSYSLVFNLLALRHGAERRLAAMLGPLFVVITGNLGGVFEVMHSLHWFWRRLADGTMVSPFWSWLNLEDLARPPAGAPVFPPSRFWFWWQASRVVNDIDLAGRHVEVIDEFPFFSFLLADNHPHVLALPFVLLALALALHVFLTGRTTGFRFRWPSLTPRVARLLLRASGGGAVLFVVLRAIAAGRDGLPADVPAAILSGLAIGLVAVGVAAVLLRLLAGKETSALSGGEILLVGWLSGTLAFLNTWDLPIYLALILAAATWGSLSVGVPGALRRSLVSAAAVAVVAGLAILPWLPTFASQAGGILPNLIFPTRLPQFLIMFAVPLVPAGLWLGFRAGRAAISRANRRALVAISLGLPLVLLIGSWLLAAAIAAFSPEAVAPSLAGMGATSAIEVAAAGLARRWGSPWTALLLSLGLAVGWLLVRGAARRPAEEPPDRRIEVFVVFLLMLGAALVLVPEFFYLKDSFGTRMNTVFKFYYAAWILWGVVAAYAVVDLAAVRARWGGAAVALSTALVALGLVYSVTALWDKANRFSPPWEPTLDGTAHLDRSAPADAAAIRWIRSTLPTGVLAEAVGGSYTGFGRISAHTGFPTVLGWDFHEFQWRGDYTPQGTRAADIERLYATRDWDEARMILDRYRIRYVYVGPLERSTYVPLVTRKFDAFMERLYDSGEVVIYGRRWESDG